jgi:hypothetical protein
MERCMHAHVVHPHRLRFLILLVSALHHVFALAPRDQPRPPPKPRYDPTPGHRRHMLRNLAKRPQTQSAQRGQPRCIRHYVCHHRRVVRRQEGPTMLDNLDDVSGGREESGGTYEIHPAPRTRPCVLHIPADIKDVLSLQIVGVLGRLFLAGESRLERFLQLLGILQGRHESWFLLCFLCFLCLPLYNCLRLTVSVLGI